jgi:hypothetical protein
VDPNDLRKELPDASWLLSFERFTAERLGLFPGNVYIYESLPEPGLYPKEMFIGFELPSSAFLLIGPQLYGR